MKPVTNIANALPESSRAVVERAVALSKESSARWTEAEGKTAKGDRRDLPVEKSQEPVFCFQHSHHYAESH